MANHKCKNCGAPLYWDAEEFSAKCKYCGTEHSVKDVQENTNKIEIAETANIDDKATDESFKENLVVYQCSNCGAQIITSENTIATKCVYCDYATTYPDKLEGEFTPDVIIPFSLSKEEAAALFKKHCKNSLLIPKRFKKEMMIDKFTGMYVPFWLHSFRNEAKAIMNCEKTETHRKGDDKVITIHQYEVNIDATGTFNRIPTDAITYLNDQMMDALEPYNYENLRPFSTSYLSGYYSEQFDKNKEETISRAHKRASATMKEEIQNSVQSFEENTLKEYSDNLDNVKNELALLPVWLLQITHKGKKYKFAVNGQTGKIAGKLPLSVPKLLSFCALAFISAEIIGTIITALL